MEETLIVEPAVNSTQQNTNIIQELKSNKLFSAGFGLGVLGAGTALLRKFSTVGLSVLRRKLLVSVELNSRDPSYTWFLNWMSSNIRHTQHLSVSTNFTRHDNGSVTTSFEFLPSTGRHIFKYKSSFMMCERQRETNTLAKSGRKREIASDKERERKRKPEIVRSR